MEYFMILVGIILFLGSVFALGMQYQSEKMNRDKFKVVIEKTKCPHGYEDWSDCPDCGH